jgi:hypothetical protein
MSKPIPIFAFVFAAYAFAARQQKIESEEPLTVAQLARPRSKRPYRRIVRKGMTLQSLCNSMSPIDYPE